MFEEIIYSVDDFTPVLMMGLIVGIGHSLEPDHLAAVGTQIFKRKPKINNKNNILTVAFAKSSLLGIFWGAGHTTSIVIIGIFVFIFAINISSEISSGFEFLVGAMLIFLGITTLLKKKKPFQHRHPHQHFDGNLYFDSHEHHDTDHKHEHKSYLIGMVHGLAGSGGLIALTMTTLDNVGMAFSFILLFGLGSIVGMLVVSGLIGLPILLTDKTPFINPFLRFGTALISLIIGIRIIFDNGILNNI